MATSESVYSRSRSASVMRFCASAGSFAHFLLPELDVHQQPQDLRISPEAAAVGMVGGQVDAPRVVDEQQQLEPDRPLDGVDQVMVAVDVRHDAAAGLVLDVEVAPLAPGQLVAADAATDRRR